MMVTNDELGVLSSTAFVIDHASFVAIDHDAVLATAAQLAGRSSRVPSWDMTLHFADGSARSANYVLVLDALNFSFWGEPRWRVEYDGRLLDGYWALAASLKRAIEEGIPLLEAGYLAQLAQPDLEYVLRGEGEIPMLEQRLANLREVGRVLLSKYGGRFARTVELADRSAVQLVQILVADFPCFDDVARYHKQLVRFYKRAQICAADLYGTFGGQRWGQFDDLDQLTAFADYKVPQVLRHCGILRYAPALAGAIDSLEPIAAGSAEEIEIRAATIWGVEHLRRALAGSGRRLRAFELDWLLWDLGQSNAERRLPYHRTRTMFY